jgi:hypothetical protein
MAQVISAVPGSERIRSNSPMAGSLSVWSRVGEATLRPGIREVDVVDGEKQWRFGGLADQPVKRVQFGERVVFGGLRSAGGRDGIDTWRMTPPLRPISRRAPFATTTEKPKAQASLTAAGG